jgi:hypothetical protein
MFHNNPNKFVLDINGGWVMSSVYAFKKPEEGHQLTEQSYSNGNERLTLVPVRTIAGDKALKSPESSMPRKLRALLSAVDNRAKTQVYVTTLTAFGDVTSMFDALEEIGMVRFVADRNASLEVERNSPQQVLAEDTSLEELLKLPVQQASPVFAEPQPRFQPAQPTAYSQPSMPGFRATPAPSAANAFMQFNQSNAAPQSMAVGSVIEKVKTLMTDFVINNFAADAMELTLAIDQIRTYDDLVASLTQYEAIAAKTGKTGLAHMQAIKALLTK